VGDGLSARLVAPNDAPSLARGLIELHDERATRDRFAAAARQRAEQVFSIERAAGELADVWHELAGS
jgi:glycosyltransferase involved in cell wall biosynthesis